MVKCPKCSHCFAIGSFICPRKISITKRDKIESLGKQIKKGTKRAEKFKEIANIIPIKFQINDDITSKNIMNFMGWADHSDGDVTLTFLDRLVCDGTLSKVRHKKGRGGHLYKQITNEKCPWLIDGKCNCPNNLYEHLEEEEEKSDGNIS